MTGAAPATPRTVASTSAFVATFGSILALIAVLLPLDLSLARIDRRASDAHAEANYETGQRLLASGRAADAAESFGRAVATDRTSGRYALALARATLAAGRPADAEHTLQELLDRAGNDGAVNLAMAHVLVRERRLAEAKAYFHRAIFGSWGADSVRDRAGARFELIDLLAREGATQELLAELLPLEDAPPDSVALRRRLGQLFIVAGSPSRGAALLRDVLRRDPTDADAYEGMGDAALALGNFRTARADFLAASRLRPHDAAIARRLALADTVLAIDPAARGVGARERYARSRALLERTLAAVRACGAGRPATAALTDSAAALLTRAVAAPDEDASGETMAGLADDLWSGAPPGCERAGPDAEPLGVLLGREGR